MEKLKLNLNELKVQSFEISAVKAQKGTVKANEPGEETQIKTEPGTLDTLRLEDCVPSYPMTCDGTCNEFSCGFSCPRTCDEICMTIASGCD